MHTLRATNAMCRVLSDGSRVRLLHLVGQTPLSVAELVRITGLTQSRVSSHLSRLKSAGFVQAQRAGATSLYSAREERMDPDTRAFWGAIKTNLDDPLIAGDAKRLAEALAARQRSGTWAETVAGHMERHYSPGRTWESAARAFISLATLGRVLDLASGDGALAELVAPRAESLTCLDKSDEVVAAGRRRLSRFGNVEFVQGDMHSLPFEAGRFDQVLALNALTYAVDSGAVLREAARVLVEGGRFVGVTLARHEHATTVAAYDHENLGFEEAQLVALLDDAGFEPQLARVTHAEKRAPHFEVITINATKKRNST